MLKNTFLVLLFINITSKISAQYYNFQRVPCVERYTNSRGQCTYYNDCQYVQYLYQYGGIFPTFCSRGNRNPVVCCPYQQASPATTESSIVYPDQYEEIHSTTPPPSIPTKNPNIPNRNPNLSNGNSPLNNNGMRISERKCAQYKSVVKKRLPSFTLTVDPQVIESEVSTCDYSNPLIVNGVEAAAGEFPHMAAVGWVNDRNGYDWSCGGSLISENFVLSAAHCTSSKSNVEPKVVRLGDHNLKDSSDDDGAKTIGIAQIIKHENYRGRSKYYDIALFRLASPVTLSKSIRPACLWQKAIESNEELIISGWGSTETDRMSSDVLRKAKIKLIGTDMCKSLYQPSLHLSNGIIDEQFCAGDLQENRDTCQGDSGGPLQIRRETCVFYVAGVTSFGKACGRAGVYTKVSDFVSWIENKVWPNQ